MSLAPLVPLAGAALGSLAVKVAQQLPKPPSFAELVSGVTNLTTELRSVDRPQSPAVSKTSGRDTASVAALLTDAKVRFREQLLERLVASGVDTLQPIILQSDGQDGVHVANGHPQREAIESIFLNDASLTGQFQFLSTAYRLLHNPASDLRSGAEDLLDPNNGQRLGRTEFSALFQEDDLELGYL